MMASQFLPPLQEKSHPWKTSIKHVHANKIKYAHNSVNNPEFPKVKSKSNPNEVKKDRFSVIGSGFTKDFLYCKHLVQGLYRYKRRVFDEPYIRGVTAVDWPRLWNELKLEFLHASCTQASVVVLLNDQYLGGPEELKDHVEQVYKFDFSVNINYARESVKEFHKLVSSTNRTFVYMHFNIDDKPIGSMIFMLYSDIVPRTCENFVRLCVKHKGGYNGSPVHRIVKDSWIQCGGFGLKSSDLNCENFNVSFDKRGVLGMANAERHVDCSTQFFVLSQPAEWMNTNYVAFGQLVEGENTLRQIEQSPTLFESPTQRIVIYDAGILNMECYAGKINKNTTAYLYQHIENTTAWAEMLLESLMDTVFRELLDRQQLYRQDEDHVLLAKKSTYHYSSAFNLDVIENLSISDYKISVSDKKSETASPLPYYEVDNDLLNNVDDEKMMYIASTMSTADSVPFQDPEYPFYFPLSDVPYPGEVTSTYDLKRYLQGDYCLEADIHHDAKKFPLKSIFKLPRIPSNDSDFKQMMKLSPDGSEGSLDSGLKQELSEYYKKAGETVSYANKTIKKIAKSLDFNDLTEAVRSNAVITDEALRKMKHVVSDVEAAIERERQIVIEAEEFMHHFKKKIRRRPTGFIKGDDLKKLLASLGSDDDDDDDFDEFGENIETKILLRKLEAKAAPKVPDYNTDEHLTRKSALIKLIDTVDDHDVGGRPTLKYYKSVLGEPAEQRPFWLHASTEVEPLEEDFIDDVAQSKEKAKQTKKTITVESYDKLRPVEVTVKPAPVLVPKSLRTTEYAKLRPSMTMESYKKKNKGRERH